MFAEKKPLNKALLGGIAVAVAAALGIGYWLFKPKTVNPGAAPGPNVVSLAPQKLMIYKWKDGQGTWHLTDEAPPAGIPSEPREFRSDPNTLPLPPLVQK